MFVNTLKTRLLPYATLNHENSWVIRQQNAPIHISKFTKNWISANSIATMDSPSKSQGLNPIENLWGILPRKVYDGGKEYDDLEELPRCVSEEWKKIGSYLLNNLISSIQNSCFEALHKTGGKAKY